MRKILLHLRTECIEYTDYSVSSMCSVRHRYARYRYGGRTERTEVSGTGINVVPNLPTCPVPVWKSVPVPAVPVSISYKVSGTVMDVVPNLPNCRVPVLMSYWTYGSVHPVPLLMDDYWYRHQYRLGYIYRRCMHWPYPVFHGGTRLRSKWKYFKLLTQTKTIHNINISGRVR